MWFNYSVFNLGFIVFVTTFLSLLIQVQSAKILSLAFVSSRSHKITYEPLLHELGARGHKVTVLSPIPTTKSVPNVKEILTFDFDHLKQTKFTNVFPDWFAMKEKEQDANPFVVLADTIAELCLMSYDLPQVKSLLNETFDLVLLPALFNECALGLLHKINASFIIMSPYVAPSYIVGPMGGHGPPSFVPNLYDGYTDRMTFAQRVSNVMAEVSLALIRGTYYKPMMESIYRSKLNDPTLPSTDEILRNASLVLSNAHFTLGSPRPFLPDVIDVGGMHCRAARAVPKEIETFINSSGKDGFILFSMGSTLRGSAMPHQKRLGILAAFAQLKQNVLWKWETDEMDSLPMNVKLSKWLPQQDLLGHPKIRMFVTHGGFGSTTESVYHGVPIIGIPMFADQHLNMDHAERTGYGIVLDYNAVDTQTLLSVINKILQNPKYKESAMRLSKVFRDQPNSALDRAVFWTEYVIRHKGAVHLRSAGRDLNIWEYHSLDVFAFLISTLLFILFTIFLILRYFYRKVFGISKVRIVEFRKKKN